MHFQAHYTEMEKAKKSGNHQPAQKRAYPDVDGDMPSGDRGRGDESGERGGGNRKEAKVQERKVQQVVGFD